MSAPEDRSAARVDPDDVQPNECNNCGHTAPVCECEHPDIDEPDAATAPSREQIEAWVDEADLHNAYEWENEEIRWRKALYVGKHSERDRRSIHAEAVQAIKKAQRFWAGIPSEYRNLVATEAGLPLTAIPEDLRVAA